MPRRLPLTPAQVKASLLGSPGPAVPDIDHLSYSSLSAASDCPKRFQLAKLAGAPRLPALWLAGGKAVHAVTEQWDRAMVARERKFDLGAEWRRAWGEAMDELRQDEPDETVWRSAQAEPAQVWAQMGPDHCAAYFRWRQRSPQWRIWTTPEGQPAIELDASCYLPGCQREIKAYIDRVFEDTTTGALTVVDIKTGTRKPDNSDQFGVYRACLEARWGVQPRLGAAFMTRKGQLADAHQLDRYTPDYVGEQFRKLEVMIAGRAFLAHVSPSCDRICDVVASCYAKDGPRAAEFDPDHPANITPF